jgi:glycosyltransferase involved in cell wall biosynthesis
MNLLWISQNVPYPPKTGVLQRNYNLLREASRFAEVYLLAILKRDILPGTYDLEEALRELRKLCRHIEVVDLPIESSRAILYWVALASLLTRDPLSVNWAKSSRMTQRLRTLLAKTQFDLVHLDTISLAAYRHELGLIPTMLNHHNIESHLLKRRTMFERNPFKRVYYALEGRKLERFEQSACAEVHMNFTVSGLDKERLRRIIPSAQVEVISNGVDVEYFKPGPEPAVPGNLLMASGMNWFPNRDAVLYMCDDIWPLLSRRIPDLSWTVVGASPPQQLLDLAAQDKRISVTGFVDDVRPYLSQAEIYLCPMRDGGGTRVKILDALAMGKAIIATTMACEGIDVTPDRNVLIANTPEEFVEQVQRLHCNDTLRESLGREARSLAVDYYSWPVIGRTLSSVYRRLTNHDLASAEVVQ